MVALVEPNENAFVFKRLRRNDSENYDEVNFYMGLIFQIL